MEDEGGVYLVSAGGRAQLKVWWMSRWRDGSLHVKEVASHMVKGNDKWRKKKSWKTTEQVVPDAETR